MHSITSCADGSPPGGRPPDWSRPAADRAHKPDRSAPPRPVPRSNRRAAKSRCKADPETAPAADRDNASPRPACSSASKRASAPSAPAVSAIRPSVRPPAPRTGHARLRARAGRDAQPIPARRDCCSHPHPAHRAPASRSPWRLDPSGAGRPCDAEHRADDRLHAGLLRGIAERHRAIQAVAIGDRRRREAQRLGATRRSPWDRSRLRASCRQTICGEARSA
jgi:hypothetical protein